MAEEKPPQKKPTCFIAMPITTPAHMVEVYGNDPDHFVHVLEDLFFPAIEQAGLTPIDPRSRGAGNIQEDIITALQTADLVLVDLSTLNPNVFFEFGVRTSLNLPACPIRDDKTAEIPFDTRTLNTPTYCSDLRTFHQKKELPRLRDHIIEAVNLSDGKNALWKHFGFTQTAKPPVAPNSLDEKFDALLTEFRSTRDGEGRAQRETEVLQLRLHELAVREQVTADRLVYAEKIAMEARKELEKVMRERPLFIPKAKPNKAFFDEVAKRFDLVIENVAVENSEYLVSIRQTPAPRKAINEFIHELNRPYPDFKFRVTVG